MEHGADEAAGGIRCSSHGARAGTASAQGLRREQEDAHAVLLDVAPLGGGDGPTFDAVGLFDGHGGAAAADFCARQLGRVLRECLEGATEEAALRAALLQLEREFLAEAAARQLGDGTTAVVAVVRGGRLAVGNVGDSEAVLCRRDGSAVTGLTELHNPAKNAAEERRVVEAGGRVAAHRVCHPFLSPQVISIAVSRSIGDSLFKLPEFCRGAPPALTAEPWVMARQLRPAEDWFVLLACDGVFDVMTLEEAAGVAAAVLGAREEPVAAAEAVVCEALRRGSGDNCTCQLLLLQPPEGPKRRRSEPNI